MTSSLPFMKFFYQNCNPFTQHLPESTQWARHHAGFNAYKVEYEGSLGLMELNRSQNIMRDLKLAKIANGN